MKGGVEVAQAQSKYCGTNAATASEISRAKYDRMQRVVPSDQASDVRTLCAKRGEDGLGIRNYPDAAETVSDRVRFEGVESVPVSLNEARVAAADPAAAARRLARAEALKTIKHTAVATGAIAGTVSAFTNVRAVLNDEKTAGEAAKHVAIDTGMGLLAGAATGTATVAARRILPRALVRGSVPVAVGLFAVEVGKDAWAAASGEIDGAELGKRAVGHAIKGGTTWAGMEAGAAIGSLIFPGGGTIIGGFVGAVVGGLVGDALTSDTPEPKPEPVPVPTAPTQVQVDQAIERLLAEYGRPLRVVPHVSPARVAA